MHDTQCCAVKWSVEVAFCDRDGEWRACAHDYPAFTPEEIDDHLSGPPRTVCRIVVGQWPEPHHLVAVTAAGETAGQAAMAACVKYENLVARLEFERKRSRVASHDRWRTMPAPRRTPPR